MDSKTFDFEKAFSTADSEHCYYLGSSDGFEYSAVTNIDNGSGDFMIAFKAVTFAHDGFKLVAYSLVEDNHETLSIDDALHVFKYLLRSTVKKQSKGSSIFSDQIASDEV